MTLRLVDGSFEQPEFVHRADLYGVGLLQLAHDPDRALMTPQRNGVDATCASIINLQYADALAIVSDQAAPQQNDDPVVFVRDTHAAAVERIESHAELGEHFSLLRRLVQIQPVRWTVNRYRAPDTVHYRVNTDVVLRDLRAKQLQKIAVDRLRQAGIAEPLTVPVAQEPAIARRVQLVRFMLGFPQRQGQITVAK